MPRFGPTDLDFITSIMAAVRENDFELFERTIGNGFTSMPVATSHLANYLWMTYGPAPEVGDEG